ncbi:hypothetical protein HPP92_003592 [Vanilla planifolia]|uniref:Uncharacterized protein n=1 Tax=Vanilla planifolia TaxID=51239 RepID=A0A835S2M8_VANPL|nr:hypothetical protein HPP92_003592 [Vanilla planifolia]
MAAAASVSSSNFSLSGSRLSNSLSYRTSSGRFLGPYSQGFLSSRSCPRLGIFCAHSNRSPLLTGSGGSDDGFGSGNFGGNGRGGGGGDGEHEGSGGDNRKEAILALSEIGRSLENIPSDLAAAIDGGRIPGEIVYRFADLEMSPIFRWLMQFGGFKERLLADDLFLAKVAMECGVGIFTKTAAEWERRRENFTKELDFVVADVVMAIIADFMLVWLPAPTVSLRPPLSLNAGPIAKFFHSCPDNAFQVALAGTSYSLLQKNWCNFEKWFQAFCSWDYSFFGWDWYNQCLD